MLELNAKEQFEKVYHEHYRFILMVCFSYFQDITMAEDILQDVFLKYLTKKPQFANSYAARSWFYKTSKNLSISQLRKKKFTCNLDVAEIGEDKSDIIKLRQAIYDLPEKYRTVIILFYYEGYQIKEIAASLKLSEANVKKRLERSRNLLKDYL